MHTCAAELAPKECEPPCKNGGTCNTVEGVCVCPINLVGELCGKWTSDVVSLSFKFLSSLLVVVLVVVLALV